MSKHEHYELLNLLGYGLAKFDQKFVEEFGFTTKDSFYNYFVESGFVKTKSVVKNRMDLFDPFFDNSRKGWWQKGNAYIHRKELIDSLFGQENIQNYADLIKIYLAREKEGGALLCPDKPILTSRFRKMQETGLEAELYFINHFREIPIFKNGQLEDVRIYGDGYDFQITVGDSIFLSEVNGIRNKRGRLRFTQREFEQAKLYKKRYVLSVVSNLYESPKLHIIPNPLEKLEFKKVVKPSKEIVEYHLVDPI